jgi:hypothetical protein
MGSFLECLLDVILMRSGFSGVFDGEKNFLAQKNRFFKPFLGIFSVKTAFLTTKYGFFFKSELAIVFGAKNYA